MLSAAELLECYLEERGELMDVAAGGVEVGPADAMQQELGVLVLADAGLAGREVYTRTTRRRISIRCLAKSIEKVERLAQQVIEACHQRNRVQQRQRSDGQVYLIIWMEVNGGPTLHRDSEVTWEMLMFVEMWIHEVPIGDVRSR